MGNPHFSTIFCKLGMPVYSEHAITAYFAHFPHISSLTGPHILEKNLCYKLACLVSPDKQRDGDDTDWWLQQQSNGQTFCIRLTISVSVLQDAIKIKRLKSSSRMRVIYHNWSAMKQLPHPQSVAEISHHSVLSGDRIRQCETSSGSRHKDTDQCL